MILVLVVAGMFFTGPARMFIDFPSLVLVGGIGGFSWWSSTEKSGRAFINAGWLVFAIGLVAGMAQVSDQGDPGAMMAAISVSAIAIIYGYLLGFMFDN